MESRRFWKKAIIYIEVLLLLFGGIVYYNTFNLMAKIDRAFSIEWPENILSLVIILIAVTLLVKLDQALNAELSRRFPQYNNNSHQDG